jgi:hypothetical protein
MAAAALMLIAAMASNAHQAMEFGHMTGASWIGCSCAVHSVTGIKISHSRSIVP